MLDDHDRDEIRRMIDQSTEVTHAQLAVLDARVGRVAGGLASLTGEVGLLAEDVGFLRSDFEHFEDLVGERFRALEVLIRSTQPVAFEASGEFSRLRSQVQSLEERVDGIYDQWVAFAPRLLALEHGQAGLIAGQVNIASHLDLLEGRVDAALRDINARFGRVDARFDEIEARFDARFAANEAVLAGVVTTLAEHGERLGGIDGRLGGIDGRLGGIDGRLGGIDGRLGGIDGSLALILQALHIDPPSMS